MPSLAHIIRRRRNRKRRQAQRNRRSAAQTLAFLGVPLCLAAAPLIALLALSGWLVANALAVMPRPQEAFAADAARKARFTDRHGMELPDADSETGLWLTFDDLPPHVIDLSGQLDSAQEIAAFDALDTLARLSAYIMGFPAERNDSLQTDLARDSLLPAVASDMDARLLEMVFGAEVTRTMDADALLAWRLNTLDFGGARGIDAAARKYLGKAAREVSPAESALLFALFAEPNSSVSQLREAAKDWLSAADLSDTTSEVESIVLRDSSSDRSGFVGDFLHYAREQAAQVLSRQGLDARRLLASGGLSITTTLDLDLQRRAADRGGAVVAIDARTGEILALTGDATAATRQPAGILQPFVYMDAFASRHATPASMLYDIAGEFANADGSERGPISLRDAMAGGLLPPVAQVAGERGMQPALDLAQTMGFNSLQADADISLLLGGGTASALDAATAYSVFAAMGEMRGLPAAGDGLRGRDPVAALRIDAESGRTLWQYDAANNAGALIQPSLIYLVNDILSEDSARAIARVHASSADKRDNWKIAYTPDIVFVAHSSDAAADTAIEDLLGMPQSDWTAPADIEEYLVCEISGMLPTTTDHCPTRREIVPALSRLLPDDRWQRFEINSATGQLATINSPDHLREMRAFFVPPEEIMDWWREAGKPMPPSATASQSGASAAKPAQIALPTEGAYVGARLVIEGVINRPGALAWRLELGADDEPDTWTIIAESQRIEADGELSADWGTILYSGLHTLRLSVEFADGTTESDTRLLTFDNTPPIVKLSAPAYGQGGETMILEAEARDNLGIELVEFWQGETLLGVDSEWQYSLEAPLPDTGEVSWRAIAFDRAGNQAQSGMTVTVGG